MKRRNFLKFTGNAAIAAPFIVTSKQASAASKTRLRMQRYWGTETDHLHKAFSKELRTTSGGTLSITQFRGGELVPNDQMLTAVSKGSLDMAQGYGGYWPGQVDLGKIESGLPGAWASFEETLFVWEHRGLLELAREAYAEQGVYYLMPIPSGPYELLTTRPVKSLKDLKSMKIRATSTMAGILDQFDIPTTYVPAEELYMALSTGVIDGLIYGGPTEYKNLKLYEVAKYYTNLNLTFPGAVDNLLINMERWNALTDEQKACLELSARNMAHSLYSWVMGGALATTAEKLFEMSSLPEADTRELTRAALVMWQEEAAKSERNRKAIDILSDVATITGRA